MTRSEAFYEAMEQILSAVTERADDLEEHGVDHDDASTVRSRMLEIIGRLERQRIVRNGMMVPF